MNQQFDIKQFLIFIPIVLISIAIHEFAHCWTTDRLGDDTPRREGRLTLNPLAHLDPLGTLMIAITAYYGIGFGWGKSSPFNPYNFRHPARDRMLTAVAGPISNLLQVLAWASIGLLIQSFGYHAGWTGDTPLPLLICWYGMLINASLAVFNLLPVYPLDGHHILSYFVPPSMRPIVDNPAWGIVFLLLVFNTPILSNILSPMIDAVVTASQYTVGWPS